MGCIGSKGGEKSKKKIAGGKKIARKGSLQYTKADPSQFVVPVRRLGVSGGTAPFFGLRLQSPGTRSAEYYIGKDLSHAADEVTFYEDARHLLLNPDDSGLRPVLDFMIEYAGVLTAPEEGAKPGAEPLELLVLRNLRDGYKNLRLLDIKIGSKTAHAGWQGKSRVSAMRASMVDFVTNSSEEGYRLEGFDSPPAATQSLDPFLDISRVIVGSESKASVKRRKKAKRLMYQRFEASEIFMHFLDTHADDMGSQPGYGEARARFELVELLLHEITIRLCKLALACTQGKIPQKWIGSSVALGYDCGWLPSCDVPEEEIRATAKVVIFDWGRSELNTESKHRALGASGKQDRSKFWKRYTGGIERLAWEAARSYHRRFSSKQGLDHFVISVWDYDALTANDLLGKAVLPLESTEGDKTVALCDDRGKPVLGENNGPATLTYSAERRALQGARLKAVWHVFIKSANNLPNKDAVASMSDPFAVLEARYKEEGQWFKQQTVVKSNNHDPIWDELFEVPEAATNPGALQELLEGLGEGLGAEPLDKLFVPLDASDVAEEASIRDWKARIVKASHGVRASV
mmetsp:Transcript_113089/g.314794  ORF Transcript_113089/g.314794 Transcript_113089/m.314794 type:complete len:575 (-) Transcript_113089:132-1856(-)